MAQNAAIAAALGQALPGLNLKSGELAGLIRKAVRDGWSQSQLLLAVYASRTFKARFPAIRNADGTLRMSPGQYIAQETALRQTMQKWGLGAHYYDKPSDFARYIKLGVTPDDLNTRLSLINNVVKANPAVLKEMQRIYGLSSKQARNGAMAFLLSPDKRGIEAVQRIVATAQIGASARQAGFNLGGPGATKGFIYDVLSGGVSPEQAEEAFAKAAMDRQQLRTFAARYHYGELSDRQIASALFHPDTEVQATRQTLFAQEAAQFRSGAGIATGQGAGIAGLQTTEAADYAA